jgi:hypothetical protein
MIILRAANSSQKRPAKAGETRDEQRPCRRFVYGL